MMETYASRSSIFPVGQSLLHFSKFLHGTMRAAPSVHPRSSQLSPSMSQTPPAASAIRSNPRNSKCPEAVWCCMNGVAASTRERSSSSIRGHSLGYSCGSSQGTCHARVARQGGCVVSHGEKCTHCRYRTFVPLIVAKRLGSLNTLNLSNTNHFSLGVREMRSQRFMCKCATVQCCVAA